MSGSHHPRRSLRAQLAAAALVVVVAGCGGAGQPAATTSSTDVPQYTGSLPTTPQATETTPSNRPEAATSAPPSTRSGSGGGTTAGGTGSSASSPSRSARSAPEGEPTRVYVFDTTGRTIVNAPLTPTYLDGQGVLAPAQHTAGWYAESGWAKPGHRGASILTGHQNYGGAPDVFANLIEVRAGNRIIVQYSSGDQVSFVAQRSSAMDKKQVPKDRTIWNHDSPSPVLRLITCDPATPIRDGHTTGNWVVWAVPA